MKQTFTIEECKSLFAAINMHAGKKSVDKALCISLLLSGAAARTWTWESALSDVLNIPFAVYLSLRDYAAANELTIFPLNFARFTRAHWLNGVSLQCAIFAGSGNAKALTTQDVTRRLKRYARLAGIRPELCSLRTLANTHQQLTRVFGADGLADQLGLVRLDARKTPLKRIGNPSTRDARLHGIGRRSLMKSA